jgi:hypothetical protein
MRNFVLYTTPIIIRMIESRRMMWVGHVACIEGSVKKRNACRMLVRKSAGQGLHWKTWENNFKWLWKK